MQKGRIKHLGSIFIFAGSSAIKFGRLTCFDIKSIVAKLVLLISASFSRNNVCKNTQFSERHLLMRKNFEDGFRRVANLNIYF